MRLITISALLFAGALQAGSSAPAYDASFVLAEGTYTGTTTFAVSRTGAVTGTMKLTSPTVVEATLAGTLKGTTWTFEYPYTIPEQGCSGTVTGTGEVAKDRASVKGHVTIRGGCVESPEEADFTFTRKR